MNNFCLFKSLYEKHGTLGTVSNTCCRNPNNNNNNKKGNRMQIEAFWKQSQTLVAGIVWLKMDTKHGTFRTILDTCCKNLNKKKQKNHSMQICGTLEENRRHLLQYFLFLLYTQCGPFKSILDTSCKKLTTATKIIPCRL